jgi:hypothetical protein
MSEASAANIKVPTASPSGALVRTYTLGGTYPDGTRVTWGSSKPKRTAPPPSSGLSLGVSAPPPPAQAVPAPMVQPPRAPLLQTECGGLLLGGGSSSVSLGSGLEQGAGAPAPHVPPSLAGIGGPSAGGGEHDGGLLLGGGEEDGGGGGVPAPPTALPRSLLSLSRAGRRAHRPSLGGDALLGGDIYDTFDGFLSFGGGLTQGASAPALPTQVAPRALLPAQAAPRAPRTGGGGLSLGSGSSGAAADVRLDSAFGGGTFGGGAFGGGAFGGGTGASDGDRNGDGSDHKVRRPFASGSSVPLLDGVAAGAALTLLVPRRQTNALIRPPFFTCTLPPPAGGRARALRRGGGGGGRGGG